VLPGKSGPEVATELLRSHPGLKVVFMSGYVSPEIQDLGLIHERAHVLSKPFAPEALCRVVGSVLQGEPAARAELAT
jgi:DNA-binding NarL/FixJ family response regulator